MKTLKDQLTDVMARGFELSEAPVVKKSTTNSQMIDKRNELFENPYDRKPSAKFCEKATVYGISLGETVDIEGLKGCLVLGFADNLKEHTAYIAVGHAKFAAANGGKSVSESTYITKALIGTENSYFKWIKKVDILKRYDISGEVK